MSTALRTYYRGHRLVAMRDEPAGQNRYYHFDHQGTTQCLTDQSGAVTDRFAANAWGVQVKRTGTSINRHWYIGNSGYSRMTEPPPRDYVRARWLAPARGTWLSRDVLVPQPPYAYALNLPTIRTDPTGDFSCVTTGDLSFKQFELYCETWDRPAGTSFTPVILSLITRVFGEVTCTAGPDDIITRCPKQPPGVKICQKYQGQAAHGRRQVIDVTRGWCADDAINATARMTGTVTWPKCSQEPWDYALPTVWRLAGQGSCPLQCRYELCNWDPPGVATVVKLNPDCFEPINRDLLSPIRVGMNEVPIRMKLTFNTWICMSSGQLLPGAHYLGWYFGADYSEPRTYRCTSQTMRGV